jgi:hypothetical protein
VKRPIGALFSALAVLIGATVYLSHRTQGGLARYSGAAGVLRGAIGGQEVLLSFTPWPPVAMREVDVTVSLPGYAGKDSPYVDLSMEGMEMGRNRVDLSRGADGRYHGAGVFVRCPSGRHDWVATVTAPGAGKAVFHFAVAD